jgi:hypothetical protein
MHIIKKRDLLVCLLVVGGLNLFALLLETALLHGAAFNGAVRNGHYYVGEKGYLTEVPFFLYRLNQLHTIAVMITTPIALIAGFQFEKIKKEAENYPFAPPNL